jgi:hypothetical protein
MKNHKKKRQRGCHSGAMIEGKMEAIGAHQAGGW